MKKKFLLIPLLALGVGALGFLSSSNHEASIAVADTKVENTVLYQQDFSSLETLGTEFTNKVSLHNGVATLTDSLNAPVISVPATSKGNNYEVEFDVNHRNPSLADSSLNLKILNGINGEFVRVSYKFDGYIGVSDHTGVYDTYGYSTEHGGTALKDRVDWKPVGEDLYHTKVIIFNNYIEVYMDNVKVSTISLTNMGTWNGSYSYAKGLISGFAFETTHNDIIDIDNVVIRELNTAPAESFTINTLNKNAVYSANNSVVDLAHNNYKVEIQIATNGFATANSDQFIFAYVGLVGLDGRNVSRHEDSKAINVQLNIYQNTLNFCLYARDGLKKQISIGQILNDNPVTLGLAVSGNKIGFEFNGNYIDSCTFTQLGIPRGEIVSLRGDYGGLSLTSLKFSELLCSECNGCLSEGCLTHENKCSHDHTLLSCDFSTQEAIGPYGNVITAQGNGVGLFTSLDNVDIVLPAADPINAFEISFDLKCGNTSTWLEMNGLDGSEVAPIFFEFQPDGYTRLCAFQAGVLRYVYGFQNQFGGTNKADNVTWDRLHNYRIVIANGFIELYTNGVKTLNVPLSYFGGYGGSAIIKEEGFLRYLRIHTGATNLVEIDNFVIKQMPLKEKYFAINNAIGNNVLETENFDAAMFGSDDFTIISTINTGALPSSGGWAYIGLIGLSGVLNSNDGQQTGINVQLNFGGGRATPVFYLARASYDGGGHGVAEFPSFEIQDNVELTYKIVCVGDTLIFKVNGNEYQTRISDHGLRKGELINISTAFEQGKGFNFNKIEYYGQVTKSAGEFANTVLSLTNTICAGYDGVTNNKSALEKVWEDLANEYNSLDAYEKGLFLAGLGGESVAIAIERYSYLVSKYGLDNFLTLTIDPLYLSNNGFFLENIDKGNGIIVVVSIALTSLIIGICLIKIRAKRKQ